MAGRKNTARFPRKQVSEGHPESHVRGRIVAPANPTPPFLHDISFDLRAREVFCFKDTTTTEIYTLSLHDALPICNHGCGGGPTSTVTTSAPPFRRAWHNC